jgi:hypothetical protein
MIQYKKYLGGSIMSELTSTSYCKDNKCDNGFNPIFIIFILLFLGGGNDSGLLGGFNGLFGGCNGNCGNSCSNGLDGILPILLILLLCGGSLF